MPELPEVETIARGLAKRVKGDVIAAVWLGPKPEPLKSPAAEIASTLQSKRIHDVRRVGKHIVFDLEYAEAGKGAGANRKNGGGAPVRVQWIVHLGMTGSMRVCPPDTPREKHTHAIVGLASGRELHFVDPRRFGRLSVARDFEAHGVEPLEVTLDTFISLFQGRKTPIKSALLDQKLLRGVGNIYADESLFRAGVRPRRQTANVTRQEMAKLRTGLRRVLKEAIRLGGSSVSDYVDSEGREGFFQLRHRVYGREGQPCLVCRTVIKRTVIAGRSSHYCPSCQK